MRNYHHIVLAVLQCCCAHERAYPTHNPFADIMGMTEQTFKELTPAQQTAAFVPWQQQAGIFSCVSLHTLKHMLAKVPQPGNGRLSIIAENVCSLQAHPDNRDALFQVASNYNVVESQSEKALTDLEEYIYDATQGPFAALSTMPALIWRQYFSINGHAQQNDTMINILSDTPFGAYVVRGYLQLPYPKTLAQFIAAADTWYDNVRLGLHFNIQVTHWAERDNSYNMPMIGNIHRLPYSYHTINQCFFAAIDFGTLNASYKNNQHAQQLAQALLKAAYEGTLLAAAVYGKHRVFLTLIGCGVFKNDANWIAPILSDNISFIKRYGLDVYLVLGSPYEWEKFNTRNQNMLKAIVLESNGSFMDVAYNSQMQQFITQLLGK